MSAAEHAEFIEAFCNHLLRLFADRDARLVHMHAKEREEFQRQHKKKHFNHLKNELAPNAWHPSRWWDWCMPEDEKKEISKLWS